MMTASDFLKDDIVEGVSPMNILICVPVIPFPMADGLRVRSFNLARELAKQHQVHLFCLSRLAPSLDQEQAFTKAGLGLTVALEPFLTPEEKIAAYVKRLVRGIPPELILSWEDLIFRDIKVLQREHRFDVAVGEHLFMGRFLLACNCPKILNEHNVEGELSRSLARASKLPGRWLKLFGAARLGRYEKKLLRRLQRATAVTVADARKLEALVPGLQVSVVENGVSCDDYSESSAAPREPGDAILFVGLMSYLANSEAVLWFVREILPLICQSHPETVFTVVGKEPPGDVQAFDNGTTVRVLGFVEDVRPLYRRSSVMVVPLLIGGGSRLKILEAFAAGTPVVSTTKGVEGLEVVDGRHLLIADAPEDFAAAVIRLREDPELYERLRINARALVEEKYDWKVLAAKLERALAEAAGLSGKAEQGEEKR